MSWKEVGTLGSHNNHGNDSNYIFMDLKVILCCEFSSRLPIYLDFDWLLASKFSSAKPYSKKSENVALALRLEGHEFQEPHLFTL